MITVTNLHKKLDNKPVLRGVNFHINEGETYVIIGRSGTGKSVTLKNIVGLLTPDSGEIKVMQKNVHELSSLAFYELRKNIGVVFQGGALINWLNVEENVALPLIEHETYSQKEVKEIVKEKLALVDLYNVENKMPSSLSGGMKKRVSLARAIVREPEIILYDEPTSGLDPVMSNQINELILSLQEKLNVTSICVTHDMNSAYMVANKIGMLYNGEIIEEGNPQEIRTTQNPIVKQFILGKTCGPLTDS
mgnify:CR=1 FL=1